jgi:sec-independent protein translocase protein TatB
MTLFNIGPVEFILILIIMFILLGPEGMIKTARQIGTWIRKTIKSPMWAEVMGYSREIRELPTKIVRETGLDDDLNEIKKVTTEASTEVQESINQANDQISQSLKETGRVEVKVSGTQVKTGETSVPSPSTNLAPDALPAATENLVPEKPKPPVVID